MSELGTVKDQAELIAENPDQKTRDIVPVNMRNIIRTMFEHPLLGGKPDPEAQTPSYYHFDAHTFAGYGATATKIPEWSVLLADTGDGTAWTFSNSDGAKWTLLKSGYLWKTIWMVGPSVGDAVTGISLNADDPGELTIGISTIAASHRKAVQYGAATEQSCSNAIGAMRVETGYVVRGHTNGEIPVISNRCGTSIIFRADPE